MAMGDLLSGVPGQGVYQHIMQTGAARDQKLIGRLKTKLFRRTCKNYTLE
jgi:hypothetical protein